MIIFINYVVSPDRAHAISINSPMLMVKPEENVIVRWDIEDIVPNYLPDNFSRSVEVDILVFSQTYTPTQDNQDWEVEWKEVFRESKDILLSEGMAQVMFPKLSSNCILPLNTMTSSVSSPVCPVAIKVSVSKFNKKPDDPSQLLLPSVIGAWSGVYYLENENIKLREVCDNWVETEEEGMGVTGQSLSNAVLSCPPTELLARNDRNYQREEMNSLFRETNFEEKFMDFFHFGTAVCYRQST